MGTGLERAVQPGTLTTLLTSCVFLKDALGHVQDESLPLPLEEALDACRSQDPDGAPRPKGSAGVWRRGLHGHPLTG